MLWDLRLCFTMLIRNDPIISTNLEQVMSWIVDLVWMVPPVFIFFKATTWILNVIFNFTNSFRHLPSQIPIFPYAFMYTTSTALRSQTESPSVPPQKNLGAHLYHRCPYHIVHTYIIVFLFIRLSINTPSSKSHSPEKSRPLSNPPASTYPMAPKLPPTYPRTLKIGGYQDSIHAFQEPAVVTKFEWDIRGGVIRSR